MIQNIKIFKLATLLMGISVAARAAVAHALESTLTTKAQKRFRRELVISSIKL